MTPCHNKEFGLDFMASGNPCVFIIALYLLIATKQSAREIQKIDPYQFLVRIENLGAVKVMECAFFF